MRPTTTLGRVEQAQKQYVENSSKLKGYDFTEWKLKTTLPSGEEELLYSDQLIPPYSRRFPMALGYVLNHIEAKYVAEVLDFHFPEPDQLDCDYLTDVFEEIMGIMNVGYLFSPTAQDGIDYYCGFGGESKMFRASMDGIDTSNTREKELLIPVMERAQKWLSRAEETAAIRKSKQPDSSKQSESPKSTPAPPQTPLILPPLEWKGTGVELAALFVELDAKGYIQLPGINNFDRTPWEKICRAIVGLFTITTQRKDSTGEPWYNFSRNFVSRAENEKTGELEYHKLHAARSKFKHMLPKT